MDTSVDTVFNNISMCGVSVTQTDTHISMETTVGVPVPNGQYTNSSTCIVLVCILTLTGVPIMAVYINS